MGRAREARRADFYSRPYARGDVGKQLRLRYVAAISTRAPTRGATQLCGIYVIIQIISTRAPTRGATAIFHKTTS